MPAPAPIPYVGRGGLKLRHALDTFAIDPTGLVCADFGCNIGGFTDCLLQAGAARVYAVDTGYGALAYKLRIDPRVVVMERTNALHSDRPGDAPPIHLIAIDMGWTPQRLCIPAALRWLRSPGSDPARGRIITLIKPHYEASDGPEKPLLKKGILEAEHGHAVLARVIDSLPLLGVTVLATCDSPIQGGAGKGNSAGNTEYLALLAPSAAV